MFGMASPVVRAAVTESVVEDSRAGRVDFKVSRHRRMQHVALGFLVNYYSDMGSYMDSRDPRILHNQEDNRPHRATTTSHSVAMI